MNPEDFQFDNQLPITIVVVTMLIVLWTILFFGCSTNQEFQFTLAESKSTQLKNGTFNDWKIEPNNWQEFIIVENGESKRELFEAPKEKRETEKQQIKKENPKEKIEPPKKLEQKTTVVPPSFQQPVQIQPTYRAPIYYYPIYQQRCFPGQPCYPQFFYRR